MNKGLDCYVVGVVVDKRIKYVSYISRTLLLITNRPSTAKRYELLGAAQVVMKLSSGRVKLHDGVEFANPLIIGLNKEQYDISVAYNRVHELLDSMVGPSEQDSELVHAMFSISMYRE